METYSLLILKPGSLGKEEEVVRLLDQNGIKVEKKEKCILPLSQVEYHYAEHLGKDFYKTLVEYMTTGKVLDIAKFNPTCIKMVVSSKIEGETEEEFIKRSRQVVKEIIRPVLAFRRTQYLYLSEKDFKELTMTANGIHASDSPASAEREINNLFPEYFSEVEMGD